jgi:hypothetical protein
MNTQLLDPNEKDYPETVRPAHPEDCPWDLSAAEGRGNSVGCRIPSDCGRVGCHGKHRVKVERIRATFVHQSKTGIVIWGRVE